MVDLGICYSDEIMGKMFKWSWDCVDCFFFNFWRQMSFYGATDTPVLDFWCPLWVSKPEWAVLIALTWCLLPDIYLWCNTCWQASWQPSHSHPQTWEQCIDFGRNSRVCIRLTIPSLPPPQVVEDTFLSKPGSIVPLPVVNQLLSNCCICQCWCEDPNTTWLTAIVS